jgi:hypothetical protein
MEQIDGSFPENSTSYETLDSFHLKSPQVGSDPSRSPLILVKSVSSLSPEIAVDYSERLRLVYNLEKKTFIAG